MLGVALTNVQKEYGILESVVNGFATAIGFTIAIVIMAGIREKTEHNDISPSFQGTPIVLVTASLMAIAFFGFFGINLGGWKNEYNGNSNCCRNCRRNRIIYRCFLGLAGKKFAVETDEREEAIVGVLPGNNCGGCGYAGCSGLAAAIVKGEAEINGCPVGGANVAAEIGKIMGVEAKEQKK